MASGHLNMQEFNALGENSKASSEQADNMRQEVTQLMTEMEEISNAIRGDAGDRFKEGVANLAESFQELMKWCSSSAMNMAEAHALLSETESDASDAYAQQASNIGGLSRGVNA